MYSTISLYSIRMIFQQNVDESCVINSASATAEYLVERGCAGDDTSVYALGAQGVQEELTNLGIKFRGEYFLFYHLRMMEDTINYIGFCLL